MVVPKVLKRDVKIESMQPDNPVCVFRSSGSAASGFVDGKRVEIKSKWGNSLEFLMVSREEHLQSYSFRL